MHVWDLDLFVKLIYYTEKDGEPTISQVCYLSSRFMDIPRQSSAYRLERDLSLSSPLLQKGFYRLKVHST